MNNIRLGLVLQDDSMVTFTDCISFSFEKERYLPYAKADGRFLLKSKPSFSVWQVKKIHLWVNSLRRHCGIPDTLSIVCGKEGYVLSFSSRGYSLLLSQNEPYPEINANVTLDSLISKNLSVPEISCEQNTPNIEYIYVKEKSTVWDAVTAYSIKAVGNYPYIRGENIVFITPNMGNTIDLSSEKVIEEGSAIRSTQLLSTVNMADINGDYTYTRSDDTADQLGIVRNKYYPLDYQWLYSPDDGLKAKLDYAGRGVKELSMTFIGTSSVDIMDLISCPGVLGGKRVHYLKVWGNRQGLFTQLKSYEDAYK